jgi:hypothetical protein
MHQMYGWAEARVFDLYEQGIKFLKGLSAVIFRAVDRPIDAVYDKGVTAVGRAFTRVLQAAHNGHYANYLAWSIGGLLAVAGIISLLV